MAQNKLQSWNEVFTILAHMPRVEFVNLSLNRLLGPVEPPLECSMSRLRSLVLNNTRLEWESVDTLINRLPSLEELHLSLNDYRNVLIDTVDDDVFYESDKDDILCDATLEDNENVVEEVPTTSRTIDNENICSACGSDTSQKYISVKRSKKHVIWNY